MRHSKQLLFALAAILGTGALAGEKSGAPLPTPKVDVVDHDFGLNLPDPYRWMEGENNADFNAWLKTQGSASRAKLDALPTLEAWRKTLAAAAGASTKHGQHRLVGNRLFFLREQAGKEGALMVREADGRERAIYDPNAAKDNGSISGYSVSPDGRKVAINLGHAGNEIGEIAVYDTVRGHRLADTPKPVWSEFEASWLPDGSGFFYTRMRAIAADDGDPMQGMGAYLHTLGQPQSADRLLARAGTDDALKIAANDFPSIFASPGSHWAILFIGGARASGRLCIAPLADAIAAKAQWRCPVADADNIQNAELHGDTLYLLSAKDAPNLRVLALDLRDPDAHLAKAKVVVPERKNTVLTNVAVAKDALYVKSMRAGLDHIERMDYTSGALTPVAMPFAGSSYLMQTHPGQIGALLSLEGWTAPRKVYLFDPAHERLNDTGLGTITTMAYPDIASEEIEATSADGTKVPLSLVYPRNLKKDGHARAIVNGYGGYGVSNQPFFFPVLLEWAQAGNVLADCHVRGGGENGDAWRIGGAGPNKQRGVEDYIACAQELAKRGFSAPARTGGYGGSMGGILTGGAYTTAPEAWGAMAVQSGIFNPVRLLAAKNGANQIAEMGDPRTEAGMKQLLAMDPYQRVRTGVRYPPLLLVTGAVDQRVVPWNSGKFGAQVIAASPQTPVWFRTDDQFGHFATNANAAALEFADIFAFFDAQLRSP